MNAPERVENELVWQKARAVSGLDSSIWRRDDYGELICRDDYGNKDSPYGWEIDHVDPWGPDSVDNLRPLNWVDKFRRGQMQRLFQWREMCA